MHSSITEERLCEAAHNDTFGLSNTGFCTACGEEHQDCEPDTRRRKCEACGERKVFGAQELMFEFLHKS
jgi:hypothetical protein